MRTWLIWLASCVALVLTVAAQESFNTMPPPLTSNFSCSGRLMGFYADVESNCRAYHMCDDHGNHFTHYCPEDTAFRQDAMICDHAYLVDCRANVNSAPLRSRIDLDNNHDAPPSSFVEPRGEGTNTRGYARSFRINPDSKSATASKYPTFVLNSSVFFTNREPSPKRPSTSTRHSTREYENESLRTRVTPKDYKDDSTTIFVTHETPSKNSISTTPRSTLSKHLQPPTESSRTSKVINNFDEDDFSFLVPPPVRSDNLFFQQNTFESLKNDKFPKSFPQSSKIDDFHFQKSTRAPFKTDDSSDSFQKESHKSVTFSPRTKMILEMVKARGLSRDPEAIIPMPRTFLEPPAFKSSVPTFSRSNFNFNNNNNNNDDYPYVETLRSIQNNKAGGTSSFSNSQSTRSTINEMPKIRSTEASIFAVPTKPLASAGDVEHDPYYPRPPTTTEAYYTPRHQEDAPKKPYFTTTRRPFTTSAKFEIPAVLPDLNSLEDLLDRRKLFFIPRVKSV